jgi:alpha-beta hydrolase superfamily lysophospholipase
MTEGKCRAIIWNLTSIFATLLLLLLMVAFVYSRTLPELAYWHFDETIDDYDLVPNWRSIESFDEYLGIEKSVFQRLHQLMMDRKADAMPVRWNRYHPDSQLNPHQHDINWNRSFVLTPGAPRGGVVLVHGLSDSPYSMRALGEKFYADGFLVVGLRVPGHGTLPAVLRKTEWQDFRHILSLATRYVSDKLSEEMPLIMVGYSNGAALITDHSLLAIDNDSLRVPDKLVMLSPAMKVSSVATFAKAQRLLSQLPGLDKLAWLDVVPEFDPFKYNSFPVAAGEQIFQLTRSLQNRLKAKFNNDGMKQFPSVLAFQSVVDATVPADSIISGLLDYLPPGQGQLVLFNVNTAADTAPMLRTGHEKWIAQLKKRNSTAFELTVIRNRSSDSRYVEEIIRPAQQSQWQQRKLDLLWPASVYSLSHIALPFPANDPWYGSGNSKPGSEFLQLGNMEKRGERGVFIVSMDQLSRLRYNPFYDYMQQKIIAFVADNQID